MILNVDQFDMILCTCIDQWLTFFVFLFWCGTIIRKKCTLLIKGWALVFMPPRSKIGRYIIFVLSVILPFCHPTKHFDLGYNFWMVSIRALILHMSSIPCDKTFPWVPKLLTFWSWPWCLTYFWKTLTFAITFEGYVLRLWHFTWVFLVTRPFMNTNTVDLNLGV
jgi:hypothetical protein